MEFVSILLNDGTIFMIIGCTAGVLLQDIGSVIQHLKLGHKSLEVARQHSVAVLHVAI